MPTFETKLPVVQVEALVGLAPGRQRVERSGCCVEGKRPMSRAGTARAPDPFTRHEGDRTLTGA